MNILSIDIGEDVDIGIDILVFLKYPFTLSSHNMHFWLVAKCNMIMHFYWLDVGEFWKNVH